MALRERLGRQASPSAAVLGGQTVKSAERGLSGTKRWAGKRVKGRKIHAPGSNRVGSLRQAEAAPGLQGPRIRAIEREGGVIVEVPEGVILPIIAAHAALVRKAGDTWTCTYRTPSRMRS